MLLLKSIYLYSFKIEFLISRNFLFVQHFLYKSLILFAQFIISLKFLSFLINSENKETLSLFLFSSFDNLLIYFKIIKILSKLS